MKLLFICLLFFGICNAQQIVRVDTLQYNSVTQIVAMAPTNDRDIIILGGHCVGYSNPDNSSGRTFLIKTKSNNTLTFLDSTLGGVGAVVGPAVHEKNIYIAVWLNSLNRQKPKIGDAFVEDGIYVLKYSTVGKLIWYKKQGFHAMPGGIAVAADGFVYVRYEGITGVRKYSADGDPVDIGSYSTFFPDESSHTFFLYGCELRKVDQSGKELWKTTLPFYNCSLLRVEDHNLYVSGRFGPAMGTGGTGVAKIDESSGSIIWKVELLTDPDGWTYFPSALTSSEGYVFVSSTPNDPGVADTRLTRIKDLSHIPVTTDIKERQKKSSALKLVPNPTNDCVTLYINEEFSGTFVVEVTDVAGRTVLQRGFESTGLDSSINLQVSELAAGMYNVKVQSGNVAAVYGKLVIER